ISLLPPPCPSGPPSPPLTTPNWTRATKTRSARAFQSCSSPRVRLRAFALPARRLPARSFPARSLRVAPTQRTVERGMQPSTNLARRRTQMRINERLTLVVCAHPYPDRSRVGRSSSPTGRHAPSSRRKCSATPPRSGPDRRERARVGTTSAADAKLVSLAVSTCGRPQGRGTIHEEPSAHFDCHSAHDHVARRL